MNNFSRTLKKLIDETKISQVEIERRSGINQASISRYKNGVEYPKITAIPNLLKAFPEKKQQCELFSHWIMDQIPPQLKNDIKIRTPFAFAKDEKLYDFPTSNLFTYQESSDLDFLIQRFKETDELRDLVHSLVAVLTVHENLHVAEDGK